MSAPNARAFPGLRSLIRPARRVLAWAALVDEERSLRVQNAQEIDARAAASTSRLNELQSRLEAAEQRFIDLESRTISRIDAVVSEAVHRSEVRDSRLATETSRLAEKIAEIEHERSAILRHLTAGAAHRLTSALSDSALVGATPVNAPVIPPAWYAVFEEIERGPREEVIDGFRTYVPLFRNQSPAVDLGCGRGEFLELATSVGIDAYGIDASPDAVEACRKRGLRVEEGDLFGHLEGLDAGSLGAAFCAQVVEHLHPEQLKVLFESLARALRPGGVAVIETPNPASFAVHVHSFWRDPTHIRPVPAPLLAFAARTAGLVVEHTIYSAPLPDEYRLAGLDADPESIELRLMVKRFNETVGVLNELLFGPQNYALVVRRPDA